jgi:hypothetical protein
MIGLLLRCYPPRWRARYGEEFAAILGERPLGPFEVADVLLGALDAQLHLRGLGVADPSAVSSDMSSRIGGWAAIAGGVIWLLVFFLSVALSEAGAVGVALLFIGTVLLLVALVGLSAFQAHRHPRLVWAAFIVPAVGALVSIVGVIGMGLVGDRPYLGAPSSWHVWVLGVLAMLVGSGLFAIATWRVDALPRTGAVVLGVGAVTVIPVLAGVTGGSLSDGVGQVLSVLAMSAFGGGWIVLGIGAIRGRRRVPVSSEGRHTA